MSSPRWPQPFPPDPEEQIPVCEKERLEDELFQLIDEGAFDPERQSLEL
ncbi:MAG: hypothetical protein ACOYYS_10145 [Chloroflexota bacterium]